MAKITDRAQMTVSGTPGTGTITLGSALTGFQTFAASGVVDGDLISYVLEDGSSWEIGIGTYTASGTTLARTTITASSNSGAAINATSGAVVFSAFRSADLLVNSNANLFTAQQNFQLATLTDGATISWNLNTQQVAKVTLGGNRTLANPTNQVAGATYILLVLQDATGSRTLSYGTAYKWAGGVVPILTTTASGIDILSFFSDGTNMYGTAQTSYA